MTHDDAPARLRGALSDPLRLAELLGLLSEGAKRQPGGVFVRCPCHDDGTASCSVTRGPDGTVRFRCFACGATGDALGLVAAVRGLSLERDFRRVLVEAAELSGLDLALVAPPAAARSPRPAPVPCGPTAADIRARSALRAVAAVVLHLGRLDDSPLAADVCAYLAGRGLLAEARADGVAALPEADALEAWTKVLRDVLPEDFTASSLERDRGRFAYPEHRLVLPWRGPDGTIDTIQRRRLEGDGEPRYVFPRGGAPLWPYGVDALERCPAETPIAFVEGALDVLASRALYRREGVERVPLGLPGVNGWRREWASLVRGRVVFVAFDADDAGDREATKLAGELASAGAAGIARARPIGAKDWAAAVQKGLAA